MSGVISKLNDLYIRFLVWLGAEPPPGYEHLIGGPAGPVQYTVQEGDTLFSVARKFGVHYELIARANQIEAPGQLQPGQILTIPPAGEPVESALPPAPPVEETPRPVEKPEPPAPPVIERPRPEPAPPPKPVEPSRPAEVTAPPPQPEPLPSPPQEEWAEEAWPLPPFEEPELPEPETRTKLPEPAPRPELPALEEQERLSEPAEPGTETILPAETTLGEAEREWRVAPEPPSPVPSTLPPSAEQDQVFRYEVQRGDTLSAIARRYGLTVKDLVEANEIADPSRLFPGQKLVIPGYMLPRAPRIEPEPEPPAPPIPPPADFFVHFVQVGDTLSGIAKRYGVTVRQLIEVNNIENPNMIRVGQRLTIPRVALSAVAEPTPAGMAPSIIVDPAFPPIGPPDVVRALYVSYFAIGHTDLREQVFQLLDTTEFNAVVIDAKGDYGWISYPSQVALAREIGAARPTAKDFEAVMGRFKERGTYTIARIVTFKDTPLAKSRPELAVKVDDTAAIWQDREDLSWTDPFLKPVWDYNIQVAIEAAQQGFDEIQFDYVRFPTTSQAGTPHFSQTVTKEARIAAIVGFLSAARGQLQPLGVKVAAATFGYTCWRQDDTLIGQDIERMAPYLDVLCPMLYPSTFGSGIPGYKVAIAYPYEVVYESARRAVQRVGRLGCAVRPWLQDFQDYRFDRRMYGREEIQAQIRACFDAGCTGFMVWNPQVGYSEGAYAPVRQS